MPKSKTQEAAMTFTSLLKHPSAVIPLGMSVAAFSLILAVLSTVGVTHPQDEGAPARIFQLLILLQVPIIAGFAFKWVPRSPRPAVWILVLQVGAAVLAVATVAWLESSTVI
jgi:hypothetical protein